MVVCVVVMEDMNHSECTCPAVWTATAAGSAPDPRPVCMDATLPTGSSQPVTKDGGGTKAGLSL